MSLFPTANQNEQFTCFQIGDKDGQQRWRVCPPIQNTLTYRDGMVLVEKQVRAAIDAGVKVRIVGTPRKYR